MPLLRIPPIPAGGAAALDAVARAVHSHSGSVPSPSAQAAGAASGCAGLAADVALGGTLCAAGVAFQLISAWRTVQQLRDDDDAVEYGAPPAELSATAESPGARSGDSATRPRPRGRGAPAEEERLEGWVLILAPVMASCSLVLMYFFSDAFFWVLVGGLGLVALGSLPFVFSPLRCALCDTELGSLPYIGDVDVYSVTSFAVSAAVVVGWLFTGEWILHDVVNAACGVTALCFVRIPAVKWSALLLCGLLCYDFFWVYLSGYVFGANVMINVATKTKTEPFGGRLHMPGTLIFPAPGTNLGYGLIGLGDLVVPGLLLQQCVRFDWWKQAECRGAEAEQLLPAAASPTPCARKVRRWGYTVASVALYALGLVLTSLSLALSCAGQPALVFLVPCCLGGICGIGWCRGDLRLLWHGWD